MDKKKYVRNVMWTKESEEIVIDFFKKTKIASFTPSDLNKNPLLLILKEQLEHQFEGKMKFVFIIKAYFTEKNFLIF